MRCIVVGCMNYHGSKIFREKGVSMHNFPKDRRRAKTWLEASTDHFDDIEETLNFITKTLEGRRIKICSEHFTQDCFNIAENRQLLTKNAIPSIFKKNKRSISVFNLPLPGNPVAGTSASGALSILFSEQEDRPTHSDDAASVTIKEHDYTRGSKYQLQFKHFLSSWSQTSVINVDKAVSTTKCLSERTVSKKDVTTQQFQKMKIGRMIGSRDILQLIINLLNL
uniref:THAP domain-containing protein 1 n=1 Tax=Leptobrachium leishanense TaxID=445787 RepID=A0A8C5QB09_9ANUR